MSKKSNSGWLNNIARVIKSPKTGTYFLAFERRKDKDGNHIGDSPYPLVINEGDTLPMRLKKDDLKGLVENGKISQEDADKICEVVKFEVNMPPKDGQKPTAPKSSKADDDVNF